MPPCSPCGYAVDPMRSGYTTEMRFYPDGPPTRVRWFKVPRGTPWLPVPTAFFSWNWMECEGDGMFGSARGSPYGPGEVLGDRRKWSNGRVPAGTVLPPVHYCGTRAQWLADLDRDRDPMIPTGPSGWPECCHPSPVIMPAGGLAFGGEAPIRSGGLVTMAVRVEQTVSQRYDAFPPDVVYQVVAYDGGPYFNPAEPSKLTVPPGMGGVYAVGGTLGFGWPTLSLPQGFSLALRTSGRRGVAAEASGDVPDVTGGGGSHLFLTVACDVDLAEGDFVYLEWTWAGNPAPQVPTTVIDAGGNGYKPSLWMHYVGPLPPSPDFGLDGGPAFGGSADFGVGVYLAPDGGAAFGGSAPLTTGAGVVIMPAGGIAFGGSAVFSFLPAPFVGGGVAYGGAGVFRFFPPVVPTGGFAYGGDAPIS